VDPRDPDDREIEALVDRSLKALPAPRAPETLLPRVMAAVAAAEGARARHAPRPWFTWPLAWQAASLAGVAIVAAAGFVLAPHLGSAAGFGMPAAMTPIVSWTSSIVDTLDAAVRVGSIVWDTYLRPVVGYLLAWVVLMSAACATFGLALGRVALGGASH
jgi:hypothetical protein